jgi:sulfur-oxidizing protein SoxA
MKRSLVALALAAGLAQAQDTRRSGFDFMGPALQAMQRDDAQNPAMLWVEEGEALWSRRDGAAAKSCADCHGDASRSMRGVAARHPAFDEATGRPVTLAGRISACRTQRQQATPWAPESKPLLALEAHLALRSRGLPVAPPDDPRLAPFAARGAALWRQRFGQLDLACAHCHDDRAGGRLGGSAIPQAHPTGYPIYRIEWQSLASLQRRMRGCMAGVRAEPFDFGAIEWTELELFLARRAAGMAVDAPAVRP